MNFEIDAITCHKTMLKMLGCMKMSKYLTAATYTALIIVSNTFPVTNVKLTGLDFPAFYLPSG